MRRAIIPFYSDRAIDSTRDGRSYNDAMYASKLAACIGGRVDNRRWCGRGTTGEMSRSINGADWSPSSPPQR